MLIILRLNLAWGWNEAGEAYLTLAGKELVPYLTLTRGKGEAGQVTYLTLDVGGGGGGRESHTSPWPRGSDKVGPIVQYLTLARAARGRAGLTLTLARRGGCSRGSGSLPPVNRTDTTESITLSSYYVPGM